MGPKKSARRVRCGQCDGCLARECGKCKACVNMVRNGGPGTLRLPCQERKCLALLPPNKAELERARREREEKEEREKEEKKKDEPGAGNKKKSAAGSSKSQPGGGGGSKERTGLTMITSTPPSGREYQSGLWRDPCGAVIKYDVDGICAGCNGERDEEAAEAGEAVLLCDGKFCSREYHLKCAGLEAVPDTEFFCPECCIMGTSKELNNYFENGESEKSLRGSSWAYVEGMLKEVLPGGASVTSELPAYSQIRDKMLEIEQQPATTNSGKGKAPINNGLTPNSELSKIGEVFVGNSIRLFIPSDEGGVYHVGRIIDFRRHFKPFVAATGKRTKGSKEEEDRWRELNGQEQEEFNGEGAYKELEFLVRFRAGTGGRKVPVHRWIVLEEHAVAVSCASIWGKAPGNPWWPATVICRSALELAITEVSEEVEGICLPSSKNEKGKGALTNSVLALFFGEQTNCELDVGSETANFLSPKFVEERDSQDNFLCVAVALAQVELEEQRRVKAWFNVKGQEADSGQALVSSVAATAKSKDDGKKSSALSANDMDLNDELERKEDRMKVKEKFESSTTGSDDDDDSDADEPMPSVPPVQPPFIAKGLHHTIVDALTSVETPGSKRKRLQSVKIDKVNNDSVSDLQKSVRQKNAKKGKK
ncbi:hypothetical protein TrVE_jg4111 [Triparma verrucosa]|uniref:Uncharacterized protein n=1 Tax=Triparma verrucosa TaxID=1606542 RepID=A0A9W7F6N9_9STRA|nr:hypothetical protein TrVE_jg4111 [Triparma verrucosa]